MSGAPASHGRWRLAVLAAGFGVVVAAGVSGTRGARPAARLVDPARAESAGGVLRDRFDVLSDTWAQVDEPLVGAKTGTWSVDAGTLRQTRHLIGFDFRTGTPLGTYLVGAGRAPDDFVLSATLESRASDGGLDHDIGVVFRFADVKNFYRFAMDHTRGRRLERKVNGAWTLLASDAIRLPLDTPLGVRLLVAASRIVVRVDGDTVFAVVDDALPSGRVGFYAGANAGARFDDLLVRPLKEERAIGLTPPAALAVVPGDTLAAAATVLPCAPAGGVEFLLDPGTASERRAIAAAPPFAATFAAVRPGGHALLARMLDAGGAPLSCDGCSDQAAGLDVGGHVIVTMGDSITHGVGDDDDADDVSADGRDDGPGYQAILGTLLGAWTGRPVTVRRETFSGQSVRDGRRYVPGIVARHPDAEFFIVLFGTNDSPREHGMRRYLRRLVWQRSIGRPSGAGLRRGDPGYATSFKDHMQRLIDRLKPSGASIIIGRVPYSTARDDGRVREYGRAVAELYAENALPGKPPDFYGAIRNRGGPPLLRDRDHPNAEGYRRMAWLAYEAIARRLRPGAPAPPAAPVCIVERGGIRVEWNAVAGARGYRVWRRAHAGGRFVSLTADPIAETRFVDAHGRAGAAWRYVVTAHDGALEGAFSRETVVRRPGVNGGPRAAGDAGAPAARRPPPGAREGP